MAHLSEDPLLLEAFRNNEDIHTFYCVLLIFSLSPDEITTEMRRRAKDRQLLEFIYGDGGLLASPGISRSLIRKPMSSSSLILRNTPVSPNIYPGQSER